jgi:3-isopropylmalate/(R)-2-methylmalate dehydratase small subunit
MSSLRVKRIEGRGVPLRGHDIDTDRIIPARFLRSVRFEGLEAHVFEDERAAWPSHRGHHPFDDPVYAGGRVLLVNRNFGCGSSREHAPQAIARWGVQAIVGESFSEIFFGNAVALGLPCMVVSPADADFLQSAIERDPSTPIVVDVEQRRIQAAGRTIDAQMPAPAHEALVSGQWDGTGLLLDEYEQVEAVAARLPYVNAFRA